MEDKKEIHYDSPEAAVYKTGIEGWVSSDGRFWGKDEHMARYSGCTHMLCEDCNAKIERGHVRCEACHNKKATERWMALPFIEWDRKAPICTWNGDHYFFTEEDLIDYLQDNELNGADVQLVLCESMSYSEIEFSYWGDEAHEDWEPPKELEEAVEKLNELLGRLPPHSYTVGKIRTSYDYTYKPE